MPNMKNLAGGATSAAVLLLRSVCRSQHLPNAMADSFVRKPPSPLVALQIFCPVQRCEHAPLLAAPVSL